MSSPRLRKQFESLFLHFSGQNCSTRLDDITEILFCTRRNARIVLNKMVEEGWIEWEPAPGRGKHSTLRFKQSKESVSESLVRQHLDSGRVEQALEVLGNDVSKLARIVESYLGVQTTDGLQTIRLPYYRALPKLNPRKPIRRSELHIVSQVFSGLTKLDENESLQPDLAHQWEQIEPTIWKFYLRNKIRLHNGDTLTSQHIAQSIRCLIEKPLFSHIRNVDVTETNVLTLELEYPDYRLAHLLAGPEAKIVPEHLVDSDNFDSYPIGTGPYRVVQNDEQRLVLEAFDNYFGYRALLDRVEIWIISNSHSSIIFPSLHKPTIPNHSLLDDQVELDPGCTYLLINKKSGLAKDEQWASYFCSRLNSLDLFKLLPKEKVIELGVLPAQGIKPGWYHQVSQSDAKVPTTTHEVTIAYHSDHPVFPAMVDSIEAVLAQDGIGLKRLPYEENLPEDISVDLWLKAMGISNHKDEALATWLIDNSGIRSCSHDDDYKTWENWVKQWRMSETSSFPAKQLAQSLVESKQLIPMFHCWLGVSKDQCLTLQNAKCNALGWFDFSRVWIKHTSES